MKFGGSTVSTRDACGLCGKNKDQVRKLVVGLHGAVCNDCIELCFDILHLDKRDPKLHVESPGGYTMDVPARVACVFQTPAEALDALEDLATTVQRHAERALNSDKEE